MKRIVKIAGIAVFVLLFAAVSLHLFYPDSFFVNKDSSRDTVDYNKDLVIGLDSKADELEPTFYDMATRNRLLQIYEPLIMPDENLSFRPVLALNFGQIDDTTWKFRIRTGVKFHDGENLKVEDVVASIERARTHRKSQLKDILSTISEVRKLSETELEVVTDEHDPLFLNRISTVLVFPARFADGEKFAPTGTGPYMYVEKEESDFYFKRFDSYWGEKPVYKTVALLALDTLEKWTKSFTQGDVQLAVSVPPSFVQSIEAGGFEIVPVPSLAVTFLVFNFDSDLFMDIDMREAVRLAVDRSGFTALGNGYLRPATQFVGGGVYGFNPELEAPEPNFELAKQYVKALYPFSSPEVSVDLLEGQKLIGEYLKRQLSDVGIDLNLNLLPREELEEKILNRKSDLYVFGFRSELGDAYDFYSSAVYRGARYNGGNYSNEIVNRKIEESLVVKKPKKRLELLRDIMDIIVSEDIYGVPMYETQLIYAISDGVSFEPRIDGYVLLKDIK